MGREVVAEVREGEEAAKEVAEKQEGGGTAMGEPMEREVAAVRQEGGMARGVVVWGTEKLAAAEGMVGWKAAVRTLPKRAAATQPTPAAETPTMAARP